MKAIYMHENQIIRKRYELQTIELILFSIIILHTIMPIVGRTISKFLTTYFLMIVVGLICVISIKWERGGWIFSIISLIGIEAINAITTIMHGGSATATLYGVLLEFCPIILALIFQKLVERRQRQLIKITVFSYIVTFFTTLVGVIRNPQAARYLATVASADAIRNVELGWQNVGGFTFVYMVVVLYPMVISYMKINGKPLWMRLAVTGVILFFFLKVEYATAMLLFCITSILWFVPSNMKLKKLTIYFCLTFAAVILLKTVVGNLFQKLALDVTSITLQERFQYIADTLNGINSSSDVGLRSKVLLKSMDSFLKHPIFGTWYLSGHNIGGHSYILDFLARYGLLGGALLFTSYLQIFRVSYKKNRNKIYFTPAMCAFMVAVVLSIVNTGNHWFELVFVIPMFFNTEIITPQEVTRRETALDS